VRFGRAGPAIERLRPCGEGLAGAKGSSRSCAKAARIFFLGGRGRVPIRERAEAPSRVGGADSFGLPVVGHDRGGAKRTPLAEKRDRDPPGADSMARPSDAADQMRRPPLSAEPRPHQARRFGPPPPLSAQAGCKGRRADRDFSGTRQGALKASFGPAPPRALWAPARSSGLGFLARCPAIVPKPDHAKSRRAPAKAGAAGNQLRHPH